MTFSVSSLLATVSFFLLDGFLVFLVTRGELFGIPQQLLQWPVVLVTSSTTAVIWNIVLFGLWGLVHSVAAQPWFQARFANVVTFVETGHVFLVVSAVGALVVMCLWQNLVDDDGFGVLWDVNPFPRTWYLGDTGLYISTYTVFDVLVYRAAMVQIGQLMAKLSGRTVAERRNNGTFDKKQIVQDGWYGIVRHPLYTFMMMMLVTTLRMDVGRLTVIVAFWVYLIPGVSWEEKRLEHEFGKAAYQAYRDNVPYKFIPLLY